MPVNEIWTFERVGGLRRLWAEGHPINEIGRRLGITRSAVSGKVNRLGLDPRESPINFIDSPRKKKAIPPPVPISPKPATVAPYRSPPVIKTPVVSALRKTTAEKDAEVLALFGAGMTKVSLSHTMGVSKDVISRIVGTLTRQDIKPDTAPVPRLPDNPVYTKVGRIVECCWPIGTPKTKDFRFCNEAVVVGRPYCDIHVKIAYAKIQPADSAPLAWRG